MSTTNTYQQYLNSRVIELNQNKESSRSSVHITLITTTPNADRITPRQLNLIVLINQDNSCKPNARILK